jgi:hypothetical protein
VDGELQVLWNEELIGSVATLTTEWIRYDGKVTAKGSGDALRLRRTSGGAGSDREVYVDDVSLFLL